MHMDVAKTRCHHQELKAAIATILDEFNFQFTLMLFQYCKKTKFIQENRDCFFRFLTQKTQNTIELFFCHKWTKESYVLI